MELADKYDLLIKYLGYPIVAVPVLFSLLLLLSYGFSSIWKSTIVIVFTYFMADIVNSFFVEIGEDYGKIFPKLDAKFDKYGHVFLTYFAAVVFSTSLANFIINFVDSQFSIQEISLQIKGIINASVIVIMWIDAFIRR